MKRIVFLLLSLSLFEYQAYCADYPQPQTKAWSDDGRYWNSRRVTGSDAYHLIAWVVNPALVAGLEATEPYATDVKIIKNGVVAFLEAYFGGFVLRLFYPSWRSYPKLEQALRKPSEMTRSFVRCHYFETYPTSDSQKSTAAIWLDRDLEGAWGLTSEGWLAFATVAKPAKLIRECRHALWRTGSVAASKINLNNIFITASDSYVGGLETVDYPIAFFSESPSPSILH